MSQSTNMRCHGGQPEGVKEQSAVAPNFLDATPIGRTTIRTPSSRPKVAQVVRVGRHEISGVAA